MGSRQGDHAALEVVMLERWILDRRDLERMVEKVYYDWSRGILTVGCKAGVLLIPRVLVIGL